MFNSQFRVLAHLTSGLKLSLLGLAVCLILGLAQPAHAADCTLTAIVWEGYTDESFAQPFEQQTGCRIKATYAGSSDEMFAKFRAGGGKTYDLVSASGDITERLAKAGLVSPIDTDKLQNYSAIFSSFQGGKWNTFDGQPYGVTFAWGPNVLVYNRDAVEPPPTSWQVLADPAYAGKISLPDNPMTIADVALWLGKPDPYDLSTADLAEVKQTLLELRPNIRKFWTTAGELANLFQSGEIVMAHAWPLTYTQLSAAGFPAASASPSQLTGWTDSWMISKNARNPEAAYQWIDYILSGAGQKGVMEVTGYSGATTLGAEAVGAEKAHELFMDDLSLHSQIKMWQSVKNYDQWVQLWNEIRS